MMEGHPTSAGNKDLPALILFLKQLCASAATSLKRQLQFGHEVESKTNENMSF